MILDYAGIALGVLSIIFSWYYGSKPIRKQRKILEHEKELSKIENYSKTTGYKHMIHDCFTVLFYSLSLFLVSLGIQQSLLTIISEPTAVLFIKQITAGLFIGAGVVLFDMFITLVKSYEPEKAKDKLSSKIHKIAKPNLANGRERR